MSTRTGQRPPNPGVPAAYPAIGTLVRARREAAGLSRETLARLAKLSHASIKAIELCRREPSIRSLCRIQAVPELRLEWETISQSVGVDLPSLGVAPKAPPPSFGVTWGVSEDLDALRRASDTDRLMRGAGGAVSASALYRDEQGAVDWLRCAQRWVVLSSLRRHFPAGELAKYLFVHQRGSRLEVWALGAGDGSSEIDLVQHLLVGAGEGGPQPSALWLIDASFPLLQRAAQHAFDVLRSQPVEIRALVSDLADLAMVPATPQRPEGQRLFTLCGGTLAELDSDARFLRYGLALARPGDLLALDFQPIAAPCEDPDTIRRREPLLSEPLPESVEKWLSGPIWRLCRDTSQVDFSVELDAYGEIPGSYGLRVVAKVQARERADRSLTMYSLRRYDPERLAAFLQTCGWQPLETLEYGSHFRGVVLLFQHRGKP